MGAEQQCSFCGRGEGPFEHAAYQAVPPHDERRYVGWLCQACARQHGSHDRFAAAMTALDLGVWLVVQPGTPCEASYQVGGTGAGLTQPGH